jgi:nucleotide-binding universal stress UspA family protein
MESVVNPTKIVCPIDFSSADIPALAQALSLARWYESELHVVHVRRSRKATGADELHGTHHELIARFVEQLDPDGVKVVTTVLTGDPLLAIAVYTRRVAADLVLVAQNGYRTSVYWKAGSFAAELGRSVQCPTIAVPQRNGKPAGDEALFRNVVCAVDFSEVSLRALEKALALVQRSGGKITLLHVLEGFPYESVYSGSRAFGVMRDYDARVRRVNRQLRALIPPDALNWCEVDAETVSGIPHDAILAVATERRANLIVMGLPRRPRLEQLATGSTVKRVLRRATRPVLIVPLPSRSTAGAFDVLPESLPDVARHPVSAGLHAGLPGDGRGGAAC